MKFRWRECPLCGESVLRDDLGSIAVNIGTQTVDTNACYQCLYGNIDPTKIFYNIYYGVGLTFPSDNNCNRCRRPFISLDENNVSDTCDVCFSSYGSRTIMDYSTNVLHYVKTSVRNNLLYLGLELELETPGIPDGSHRQSLAKKTLEWVGKDFAIAKRDGTVPGFELVTIPATLVTHRSKWEDAIVKRADQIPKGLEAWNGTDNGLHIHISRKPLPATIVPKLRSFMYSKDNHKFVTNIAGRICDRFAKITMPPFRSSRKGAAAYIAQKNTKKFSYYEQVDLGNKYQGLFVHPSGQTLEFRLFKPTLEYDRLMVDLEFTQSLIEFLANSPLGDLKTYEYKTYIQWLEKNKSFEYSHIRKFIKEGRHDLRYGELPVTKKVEAVPPNPTQSPTQATPPTPSDGTIVNDVAAAMRRLREIYESGPSVARMPQNIPEHNPDIYWATPNLNMASSTTQPFDAPSTWIAEDLRLGQFESYQESIDDDYESSVDDEY